ncbi:MAG: GNAT family N-acetyltransferase [Candidatus Aminicenantes bacterium]|nr:MAG: GNAT family N-acetyltransferase [Candidatus Aminicenantes bacterium]
MADYIRVIELWTEANLPLKPEGRDSREEIEKQIKLPQVIFLVAENVGQVIGTVLATHDGRKGWINRLAVAREYRHQGLGQRLVREAEKELEKCGIMMWAALIEEDNQPSINLFEKLGYEYHPEIKYFTRKKFPGV